MTFGEWIASNYNEDGFVAEEQVITVDSLEGYYLFEDNSSASNQVYTYDTIENNHTYSLRSIWYT